MQWNLDVQLAFQEYERSVINYILIYLGQNFWRNLPWIDCKNTCLNLKTPEYISIFIWLSEYSAVFKRRCCQVTFPYEQVCLGFISIKPADYQACILGKQQKLLWTKRCRSLTLSSFCYITQFPTTQLRSAWVWSGDPRWHSVGET